MKREDIIEAFARLGDIMVDLGQNQPWGGFVTGVTEKEYNHLNSLISKEHIYNGWFTASFVRQSILALGKQLNRESLSAWLKDYKYTSQPKTVAVIMAGNIPLVGFHDFLCVLMSGHKVIAKLSSDDKNLLPALSEILIQFNPDLKERIAFSLGKIQGFDAVIATGSNNSALYFESYFGKYPHIFRKNRTSVAVLSGKESEEELKKLGSDIFDYYGLGCRNVSHLLVPENFDLDKVFGAIVDQNEVIYNKKYGNNYDYNKAVHLMNKIPLLDNNFVLFRETEDLFSPLAMVHYHYYKDRGEVTSYLEEKGEEIQAVVGMDYIPFGAAQCPMLNDYADGIDTMKWLNELG